MFQALIQKWKSKSLKIEISVPIIETPLLVLVDKGPEIYVVSSADKFVGAQIRNTGDFEFSKFEECLKIFGPGLSRDLLVDVGGNIGSTCIPAVKRGHFKNAIAFEPDPLNHSLLSANVALNQLQDKIIVYQIALGDRRNQKLNFELSPTNHGDHRVRASIEMAEEGEADRQVIEVESTTLDSFVKLLPTPPSLIWIDVQGFEGWVLSGAKKILSKKPPLVVEFWPYSLERTNCYHQFKVAILNAKYKYMYDLRKPDVKLVVNESAIDQIYAELRPGRLHTDLAFTAK